MEEILVPIMGMLVSFGSIFGIAYIFFMTRHKERMALIEKGITNEIFNKSRASLKYWGLKLALLLFGSGIGILVGMAIDLILVRNVQYGPAIYFATIFIFGGIGLLVSFFMEKKYILEPSNEILPQTSVLKAEIE